MTIARAPSSGPLSPLRVFGNRNFTLMWTGQFVSTVGTALTSLAASILVYRETGSALSVGLMLIATAAPSLLVGLLAGVFVDRYDRKRIMIMADVLRAALVVAVPFLVELHIGWLYVIVALASAIGQFFEPAHASVLPEVASDEELAAANSLIAISAFGSTALGFAASGFIAARLPIAWAFYLDGLTFIISAVCILLIRLPRGGPAAESGEPANAAAVIANLRAGMRFLFDNPMLRSLFTTSAPVLIGFGLSNALLLPFAHQALGASEFEYGVQEALTSVGFVVGSLLMASLADRWREGQWLAVSFVGMALTGVVYAYTRSVPLAIAIITLQGFLNAPSSIARRLIIQRHAPREMRGRVNSAFFVSRDVLFLVGMGAAGLADVIDVRLMMLASALLVLASGVWVLFVPGLGQPAAEWRRALSLLRAAGARPGLGAGRPATLADLDRLAGRLPALAGLSDKERDSLLQQARVLEAPAGAALVHVGEAGDSAFFVLDGKAVAGIPLPGGGYRSLSAMQAGDFFGEIGALTGAARTANVVADEPTTLLQVPGAALRQLMHHTTLSRLLLSTMTERLARTQLTDLPRFGGVDQDSLRELRSAPPPSPAPAARADAAA